MWVSRKKWNNLVCELDAKRIQCSHYKGRADYYQKEFNYYKQLYLDEQQKRLELAEMVRKMEGD